ncbi:hypothetical protein AB0F46_04365 [Streptomyces sp. NPDC026665]|uniref:hypothetical protein n=1 Tax=Streptomyces sp. NPDC026665 TaxID=3154798 RepID=UPI0033FC63D2
MDSAILLVLGIAGVVSITVFAVKGILDQLPEVAESWHRAKRAFRNNDQPDSDSDDQPDLDSDAT